MFCSQLQIKCAHLAVKILIAAGLTFSVVRPSFAYDATVLAKAMEASRAQITDLSMHWSHDYFVGSLDNPHQRGYGDAIFKIQPLRGRIIYDILSGVGPPSGPPRHAESSYVIAFDGEQTLYLDRAPDGWGRMAGTVSPGYSSMNFNGVANPYSNIWGSGGAAESWDQLILKHPEKYAVDPTPQTVGDMSTIVVTGPYLGFTVALWIAPNHGFLPVQVRCILPVTGYVGWRKLYDLKEVKTHVWLPQRIESYADNSEEKPSVDLFDHMSDAPVAIDEFQPRFPPGAKVTDFISGVVTEVPLPTTRPVDPEVAQRSLEQYYLSLDAQVGNFVSTTTRVSQ